MYLAIYNFLVLTLSNKTKTVIYDAHLIVCTILFSFSHLRACDTQTFQLNVH